MLARLQPVAAPVALATTSRWHADGSSQLTAEGTLGLLSGRVAIARNRMCPPGKGRTGHCRQRRKPRAGGSGDAGPASWPRRGPAGLTITPAPPLAATLDGRLSLADATVSGSGRVRFTDDGAITPDLRMRLEAADLSRLLASIAALEAGAVPARLSFGLSRQPGRWTFDALDGVLAGAPVSAACFWKGARCRACPDRSRPRPSPCRASWASGARGPPAMRGAGPWSAARFAPRPPFRCCSRWT